MERGSSIGIIPAILGLAFSSGPAMLHAQSDGQLGAVSRASVHISLSIAPRLKVDRMEPVPASAGQRQDEMQPFCIWSNASVGTFSVRASEVAAGAGTASARAGGGPAYELMWRDSSGRLVAPGPGATLTGLAAQSGQGCPSQATAPAGLLVRAAPAARRSDPQGREHTLLLLVAPD